MVLGDLGAEVTKVDEVHRDQMSKGYWIASAMGITEDIAAYDPLNRNKRSLTLNLKSEDGRQIFYKLAKRSDIIVEGFRPGVAKRLGIGYEIISEINPRIIYCSLTGYGQNGPLSNMPGHDINYLSVSGVLSFINDQDGKPVIPSNVIGDFAAGGMQAAVGILTALLTRERIGKGQYIDISIADGIIWLLAREASHYFREGIIPKGGETRLTGALPYYNVYQTKDGKYISLACIEPQFWGRLCHVLGRDDFIPYQDVQGEKQEEIFSYFTQIFLTKTRDEWLNSFTKHDIPIAPVYTFDEVFSNQHIMERDMVIELDHKSLGKIKQVGIGPKLSLTPGKVRSLAPKLGEHTAEILIGLGYSPQAIDNLRLSGAV